MDRISCEGCDRSFLTIDGPGMIASIKGPCPSCGGRFVLERDPGAGVDAEPGPVPASDAQPGVPPVALETAEFSGD
jgi:hypothetical protein